MSASGLNIVFYDGLCGLCNKTVRFVLALDQRGQFKFAALQGSMAAKTLKLEDLPDSIVVKTAEGGLFLKSEAILAIASRLSMPWKMIGLMARLIPRWIRDWIYDFVARHRKKIFGRYESCPIPKPGWKERFIID